MQAFDNPKRNWVASATQQRYAAFGTWQPFLENRHEKWLQIMLLMP
jgi:hypothetical protein